MFKTLIIYSWLVATGYVKQQHDAYPMGVRKMYVVKLPDKKIAKYAYRAEIIEFIKTGEWKYDEELRMKENLKRKLGKKRLKRS